MRIGSNPHKDVPREQSTYLHQVIIPVYIPDFNGYFKDSFKNFKLCLGSLFQTAHEKTYITIVNNGSHREVQEYLDELYRLKKIHEIVHTDNIGKISAAIKGVSGHNIELLTIADADVLFLSHWQYATNEVFQSFPKAGVVGIVPQYKTFCVHADNIIFDNLFSSKLRFLPFKNLEGLDRFYKSIGWEKLHELHSKLSLGIVADNGVAAFLGSGHFVSTYKRDIFEETAIHFDYKLGGKSEDYIDALGLKKDYWRLTTHDNYAFHMGNIHEPWMDAVIYEKDTAEIFKSNFRKLKKLDYFSFVLKHRIFRKMFRYKKIKRIFYRFKKLPPAMIGKY